LCCFIVESSGFRSGGTVEEFISLAIVKSFGKGFFMAFFAHKAYQYYEFTEVRRMDAGSSIGVDPAGAKPQFRETGAKTLCICSSHAYRLRLNHQ